MINLQTKPTNIIIAEPALSSLGLAILLLTNKEKRITCQNLFTLLDTYSPTLILKTVRYLIVHQLIATTEPQSIDPPLVLTPKSQSYL